MGQYIDAISEFNRRAKEAHDYILASTVPGELVVVKFKSASGEDQYSRLYRTVQTYLTGGKMWSSKQDSTHNDIISEVGSSTFLHPSSISDAFLLLRLADAIEDHGFLERIPDWENTHRRRKPTN